MNSFGGPFWLSVTQQGIVDLIIVNPEKSASSMADVIGITDRAVRKNLAKLIDAGIIRRSGGRKTGLWIVSEKWMKNKDQFESS